MSAAQIPPWLQEHLAKLQQAQQNLQSVLAQKQHLEVEGAETSRALEELEKAGDDDAVFRHAGTVMIRSTKKEMTDELAERREMAKTRAAVLAKQEERVRKSLKEQEERITELMKGGQAGAPPGAAPPAGEDPRK